VMGDQSYEGSRVLGTSIAHLLEQEKKEHAKNSAGGEVVKTLIIASSDLSHYHSYSEADKMDHKMLAALHAWDYLSMSRNFEARIWEACGGAPIMAAMIAAERLGATDARVLKYANSGDTAGDRSRVVGYSADIFVRTESATSILPDFSLSEEDRRALLVLARKSVEHAVLRGETFIPAAPQSEALHQERGAFVTLTIAGNLRGCIGYTSAFKPLYLTVRDTAAFAALRDPRFPPVRKDELSKLQYEISVLSPLRHAPNAQDIRIGQDGLLVRNGDREGLLLPQVPAEHHWDRARFLQETCYKAGLEPGCWKDESTDIFRFTAVVFSEHELSSHN
ncbi:MAG TPA: AmmeMemoRadiSam system protein A, partial [Terriglobales bacterium]